MCHIAVGQYQVTFLSQYHKWNKFLRQIKDIQRNVDIHIKIKPIERKYNHNKSMK